MCQILTQWAKATPVASPPVKAKHPPVALRSSPKVSLDPPGGSQWPGASPLLTGVLRRRTELTHACLIYRRQPCKSEPVATTFLAR